VHVEGLGDARESIDLVGTASLAETLGRVKAGAATRGVDEWVLGRGWDQNDWPGAQFPSAKDLDPASGGRPAAFRRIDGHALWVNTRALERAGITSATADPPGGRIHKDAAGQPTGILIDRAMDLVSEKIPTPAREVRKRRLLGGLRASAEAGLTSVHDAGVDLDAVALYKELLAEKALPIRVYVMLRGPVGLTASLRSLQPETGLGDGMLTVRAIKVSADGALGSRGALLLEPYADEPGKKGLLTVDPAAYAELLKLAVERGFQVNTHAIGDGANRFALDAYEQALAGRKDARFRIEHAQVLAPSDVPRFEALGVIPSMQPTHCTSDMYWATDRLGPERAKGAYLWKTFLDQGVPIAGGSDAPVEKIDVVDGIYAAVTRQDAKGWPEGGWHPEERVTPTQALEMFATHAAYAAFEEKDRGRIAPGFRADLSAFDLDPTTVPAARIKDMKVTATIVAGEVVHPAPVK
ncbi:MAG TPA: amidohydrolase, partial [Vicinamibacteria bacterium]|nr:amidohydrolase [Vicinamibacteria bacterium]